MAEDMYASQVFSFSYTLLQKHNSLGLWQMLTCSNTQHTHTVRTCVYAYYVLYFQTNELSQSITRISNLIEDMRQNYEVILASFQNQGVLP